MTVKPTRSRPVRSRGTAADYRSRLVDRDMEPTELNEKVAEMRSRNFSGGFVNTMISGGLATPGYIFSTKASYDEFTKTFNNQEAEPYIQKSAAKMNGMFEYLLTEVLKIELNLATKLANEYGFKGDPKVEVLKFFNAIMSGSTEQLNAMTPEAKDELRMMSDITAETLMAVNLGEYLDAEVEIKLANGSDVSPLEKQKIINMRNRVEKNLGNNGLENVKKALSLMQSNPFVTDSELYKRALEAGTLIKNTSVQNGLTDTVLFGKGIIQEARVMYMLLSAFNGINSQTTGQVNKVTASALGNQAAAVSDNSQIANSFYGLLQKNIKTSSGLKATTDVVINIDNVPPINVDVKTSALNRYIKSSIKFDLLGKDGLMSQASTADQSVMKGALMSVLSDINVKSGGTSGWTGSNKALRVIMPLVLQSSKFVASYLPNLNTKSDAPEDVELVKNFQSLIALNNKVHWYSDLVRSFTSNITDFSSGGFYRNAITLSGLEDIKGISGSNSDYMYRMKRNIIKQKKYVGKSYQERYSGMMQEQNLTGLFSKYWSAAQSFSVDVSAKFTIK